MTDEMLINRLGAEQGTNPARNDEHCRLILGDCLEKMKELPENSADAIVCDPPYELNFMGKSWDTSGVAFKPETWKEAMRILKPAGHLLTFGGTRTYHRMTCAIEDAGFEIRDCVMWIYGSGFPKSLSISKAIDRMKGAEREVVGRNPNSRENCDISNTLYESGTVGKTDYITKPASPEAKQWDGWGTALKPAVEPIVLARKPLSENTIAENVLKWGTGGLNIDACRIGDVGGERRGEEYGEKRGGSSFDVRNWKSIRLNKGRFPANLILDEEAGKELDKQAPLQGAFAPVRSGHCGQSKGIYGDYAQRGDDGATFYSDGLAGASRFFYCAKASRSEREEGLGGLEPAQENLPSNNHPTVKPVKLMEYLIKLITPPNGVVLDPFMGSGTTGVAAMKLSRRFIGIELDEGYFKIAEARIKNWQGQEKLEG